MSAVSGSAFGITGEWDTIGLLMDNILELFCLKSAAPTCNLVML